MFSCITYRICVHAGIICVFVFLKKVFFNGSNCQLDCSQRKLWLTPKIKLKLVLSVYYPKQF